MSIDEVKQFMREKEPDEYNLIDVRQPREYELEHIPGAKLIPVGQIDSRAHEISQEKPTIVYCASGSRSRAAASVLKEQGFENAYNIEGGINEWEGLVAEGPPEAGMAFFKGTERPEELIGLAWTLEEGSRRFYASLSDLSDDRDAKDLFLKLSDAEKHHETSLAELYRKISGKEPGETFPLDLISTDNLGDLMEGGMSVSEGIDWVKRRGLHEALELSISLESNSYDLYIKMSRITEDERAQNVFKTLVKEEKHHLDKLAELLDRKLEHNR